MTLPINFGIRVTISVAFTSAPFRLLKSIALDRFEVHHSEGMFSS